MENLSGKLVTLRALRDEDFEYLASLRNDLRTQAWNQRLPPCYTAKKIKERFEERFKGQYGGIWGIETKEGKLIGYIDYSEGPPRLGATAGLSVGVEYWGKGYTQEAMEILIRFLFTERGLQVVWLWTQSSNTRAVGLARKMGFKASGRIREDVIMDGRVADTLLMDMVREEYYKSRGMEDGIKTRIESLEEPSLR